MAVPQLVGSDGRPVLGTDGLLLQHAQTFASVFNAVTRTYSYRWDEAVKDSHAQSLAMRRDPFIRSLLQERKSPTRNLNWSLEVDDEKDPVQKLVKDGLTKVVKATPRFRRMKSYLLESLYYGRYGAQILWGRGPYGVQVTRHAPVNGDKVQYQHDGTPLVLVHAAEAARIAATDRDAVVPTDRGGMAVRLYRPEWRRRFVIHAHEVDDADYFEGDMAGGVHGVGLRSLSYWGYWLRNEVFTWMLSFFESTGMMDLVVFNFPTGNAAAKAQAEANAKAVTGKIALVCPREPGDKYPAVETISTNVAGVEALRGLINENVDRYIERLWVGQSMSAGEDGDGSLGGSGRARFAESTKFQLLEFDADNLDETLTADLVEPAKRFNYPYADFPVRFKSAVGDPEAEAKLSAAQVFTGMGGRLKEDEVREATGFTKPADVDEVIGGQQPGPGPDGGDLVARPGEGPDDVPSDASLADLYVRLGELQEMVRYAFDEAKVSRGQPANDGSFAPVGGGGKTGRATREPTPAHDQFRSLFGAAVGSADRLSAEQRSAFAAAGEAVVARMNGKATERLAAGAKAVRFYPDTAALTDHLTGGDRSKVGGGVANGAYHGGSRTVHLNGDQHDGKQPMRQIYAHEMTHAIDGPTKEVSSSAEWRAAWEAEIRTGRLTKYATTSPSEGLAEFGRLVWGTDHPPEVIEQRYPKCAAVLRSHGLWD